jgi:hypothetical protein
MMVSETTNRVDRKDDEMTTQTFNQFCKWNGINADRAEFYRFAAAMTNTADGHKLPELSEADWQNLYDLFTADQDARDLAETQADCLGTLY